LSFQAIPMPMKENRPLKLVQQPIIATGRTPRKQAHPQKVDLAANDTREDSVEIQLVAPSYSDSVDLVFLHHPWKLVGLEEIIYKDDDGDFKVGKVTRTAVHSDPVSHFLKILITMFDF
jgi:hypothetical protein